MTIEELVKQAIDAIAEAVMSDDITNEDAKKIVDILQGYINSIKRETWYRNLKGGE